MDSVREMIVMWKKLLDDLRKAEGQPNDDRTYQQFARSISEFVESIVIDYEIWSGSDSPGR
jgi:hypothetical protein